MLYWMLCYTKLTSLSRVAKYWVQNPNSGMGTTDEKSCLSTCGPMYPLWHIYVSLVNWGHKKHPRWQASCQWPPTEPREEGWSGMIDTD